MHTKGTFSIGWFIATVIVHVAGTLGLCLLAFVAGMSAFTYGDGREGHLLLWLWTPAAMACHLAEVDGRSPSAGQWIVPAALAWSLIVGICGGYFFRRLFSNDNPKPRKDIHDRQEETTHGKEVLPDDESW